MNSREPTIYRRRQCHPEGATATEGPPSAIQYEETQNLGAQRICSSFAVAMLATRWQILRSPANAAQSVPAPFLSHLDGPDWSRKHLGAIPLNSREPTIYRRRQCHPEGATATEGPPSAIQYEETQNLGAQRSVRVLPSLCLLLVGRFFGRRPTLRVGARSLRLTLRWHLTKRRPTKIAQNSYHK